jgi:hypothetical protein
MVYCRFRGPFTPEERKLVEQAVAAVEDADGLELPSAPKWLVMRVSPAEHAVYVGVRFRDGQVVRASALNALIGGIKAMQRRGK